MEKRRLRQITDSIHDTIYLSQLESDMASTAFFYRLHDVYQSSTVYMTFPSNRTKRYEHSIGTMQLAAEMFHYAVANSEKDTIDLFFQDASKRFDILWNDIKKNPINLPIYHISEVRGYIDRLSRLHRFDSTTLKKNVSNEIDKALMHFIPDLSDENHRYLYICILEAIRIAALFHDVGHPPFSHIIEDVLTTMRENIETASDRTKKEQDFFNLINHFSGRATKERYIKSASNRKAPALHEAIGLEFLETAFSSCFEKTLKQCKPDYIPYYITIYEFTFAILEEKDQFWTGIHRIIDGPFDADRLDYIVRDSVNSGVDWGRIPYKRIIESAKLTQSKNLKYPFQVAFPQKIAEDIDDILLIRFKIFSRINANHRCLKTAMLLQKSVKSIAENYLSSSDRRCIWSTEIEKLWLPLEEKWGPEDMKISQWNDSWLITELQNCLINIKDLLATEELEQVEKEKTENVLACLETILLNYTNYHCLIKRGCDLNDIYIAALEKLSLSVDTMEKHVQDLKKQAENDLIDTIGRITDKNELSKQLHLLLNKSSLSSKASKLEHCIGLLDRHEYTMFFKNDMGIDPWEEIKEDIKQHVNGSTCVKDCLLYSKEIKNGISALLPTPDKESPQESIPLYDNDGKVSLYNARVIGDMIQAVGLNYAPVHYFVRFNPECIDPKSEINKLRNLIIDKLANKLAEQYQKEFGINLA